jgi:hypothetical protein
MAVLTMEAELFVDGSEESRFLPCFASIYAALRSFRTCS